MQIVQSNLANECTSLKAQLMDKLLNGFPLNCIDSVISLQFDVFVSYILYFELDCPKMEAFPLNSRSLSILSEK